jgi:hypothetical protein
MRIIDWDPAKGDLCQGDVILFRIPGRLALVVEDEVKPRDSRLILAEGEVTGHHHAIWEPQPAMFRDDGLARELEAVPVTRPVLDWRADDDDIVRYAKWNEHYFEIASAGDGDGWIAEHRVDGHTIWTDRYRTRDVAKHMCKLRLQAATGTNEDDQLAVGTAKLWRAPETVRQLIQLGELAHGRLAIGFLIVDHAPVVLRHDEHDAVRIPPGRYYVGGQSEWDAAEERRVAD